MHGAAEGRDPHPLFDTSWYLSRYPDVAREGVNPLAHYVLCGAGKKYDPHPLVDANFFMLQCRQAEHLDPLSCLPLESSRRCPPHPLFDSAWYLSQNPDVAATEIHPLIHYVTHGTWEGRDPHPLFDNDWYISENPDVASARINPLAHYIEHGAFEGRSPNPYLDMASCLSNPDVVQARTNPLVYYIEHNPWFLERQVAALKAATESFGGLALVEPDLRGALAVSEITSLRSVTGFARGPRPAAWRKLFRSLARPYDRIIFAGGTDLVAMNAFQAAQQEHGRDSTLLILDRIPPASASDALPRGPHVRFLDDLHPRLAPTDRAEIVSSLIYHLRPKAVLNANNTAAWRAIEERGTALSRETRLYAFAYNRMLSEHGRLMGSTDRYFRSCLPHLTRMYLDNGFLKNTLIQEYGIPVHMQDRLVVVHQPPRLVRENANPDSSRGLFDLSVFWAGPLSRDNNATLFIELARRRPAIRFDLYGDGDRTLVEELKNTAPPNVQFAGGRDTLVGTPVERYSALIHTSACQGLPDIAIEAAALGVPIVAAEAGGISELVTGETGWPITRSREPEDYLCALDEILRNPQEAANRVMRMSALVGQRHSWEVYVGSLSQPLSFLDEPVT
jgi:glycosyltransferase involved in cell wall biosynthesis